MVVESPSLVLISSPRLLGDDDLEGTGEDQGPREKLTIDSDTGRTVAWVCFPLECWYVVSSITAAVCRNEEMVIRGVEGWGTSAVDLKFSVLLLPHKDLRGIGCNIESCSILGSSVQ